MNIVLTKLIKNVYTAKRPYLTKSDDLKQDLKVPTMLMEMQLISFEYTALIIILSKIIIII